MLGFESYKKKAFNVLEDNWCHGGMNCPSVVGGSYYLRAEYCFVLSLSFFLKHTYQRQHLSLVHYLLFTCLGLIYILHAIGAPKEVLVFICFFCGHDKINNSWTV